MIEIRYESRFVCDSCGEEKTFIFYGKPNMTESDIFQEYAYDRNYNTLWKLVGTKLYCSEFCLEVEK